MHLSNQQYSFAIAIGSYGCRNQFYGEIYVQYTGYW